MSGLLGNDSLVLFQGDSITDAGRDKNNPASLGSGYAMMVASLFAAMYPHRPVRFVNRGISGNRVRDLLARWEQDCIALKPDWVSILFSGQVTACILPKRDRRSSRDSGYKQ